MSITPLFILSYKDVAVNYGRDPQITQIHIKQSKTDPFRKGVNPSLGRTDNAAYQVGLVLAYLAVRGSQPGTLFLTRQNRPLMQQHFGLALTAILIDIGLSPHNFNTHSFRIRPATSAKHANISDTHIKMLGRWHSDIYQSYICMAPSDLAAFSRTLVSQFHNTDNHWSWPRITIPT